MPTVEVDIRRVTTADHPVACIENLPQFGNLIEHPRLQDLRPAERLPDDAEAALDRSPNHRRSPRGLND